MFVVITGQSIADGDNSFVNWFGLLFFGLAYPIGLFVLLDPRIHISLTKDGIYLRQLGLGTIPWDSIVASKIDAIGKATNIYMKLNATTTAENETEQKNSEDELYENTPDCEMLTLQTDEVNVDHRELHELIEKLSKVDIVQRAEIISTYPRHKLIRRIWLWKSSMK